MGLKNPSEFDVSEVLVWVAAIGLSEKVPLFEENAVDGHVLVQ
jgi:hypothetical protein